MACKDNVRPDFIGNDNAVVCLINFHCLFQFPAFPDTPARIVGAAQNCHMDIFHLDFHVHIFIVHPPNAVLVLYQRAVDNLKPIVANAHGKPDIGGAVEEHCIPRGCKRRQCRNYAPQHPIFIPNAFFRQASYAVAGFLPFDNGAIIFVRRLEIPVSRVPRPLNDCFRDCGDCGEIHIGHPHRDCVKAFLGGTWGKPGHCAKPVHCYGVLAMAVHNRCKIVLHNQFLLSLPALMVCWRLILPDGWVSLHHLQLPGQSQPFYFPPVPLWKQPLA